MTEVAVEKEIQTENLQSQFQAALSSINNNFSRLFQMLGQTNSPATPAQSTTQQQDAAQGNPGDNTSGTPQGQGPKAMEVESTKIPPGSNHGGNVT